MSAHTGPPGNGAGAHGEAGAGTVERLGGGCDVVMVADPVDRYVESYLRSLIASCDDRP